jgi:hypothetical protein
MPTIVMLAYNESALRYLGVSSYLDKGLASQTYMTYMTALGASCFDDRIV